MTYQIKTAVYDMRHVGKKYWIVTLHGRTVFRGLFHACMTWIDQQPTLITTVKKTDAYPNWEDHNQDTT